MRKEINPATLYTVSSISYLEQAIVSLESARKHTNYENYFIFIVDIKDISLDSVINFFKKIILGLKSSHLLI